MGVYIKDMEMPADHPLWIIVHSDGTVEANEVSPSRPVGWQTLRNAAVPVPSHGRLIDADELAALMYANIALFDSAKGRMGAEQKLVRAWLASMVDDINDAPTILEAEEGE